MKPIWYFVGLILIVMGVIILIEGILLIINPPQNKTVLFEIHPNIWWSAVMIIGGLIFLLKNRKVKIE
ncbi:MAG: hypothetical protein N3A61_00130 [Ignavibacteria bacterium]|nr:hypothetical protein [Ignavibacteria bacterium]